MSEQERIGIDSVNLVPDFSNTKILTTDRIGIRFSNDRLVLEHGVNIVGSPEEIRKLVEDLILQTLEELRRRGVDTQAVAEDLTTGRFAPWAANPHTVHDRLLDKN